MSVLIKHMAMPKGCMYANDKDQTEYCPLLNHDDVPFCQYIENEPEIAIGIDERPVYCPLSDVPEPCEDAISRQDAIDVLSYSKELLSRVLDDMDVVGTDREKYSWGLGLLESNIKDINDLPSAQPEPAIPLQWIEAQIEWLKSLDNAFSTLTAGQVSAMVNKWKDEQNE